MCETNNKAFFFFAKIDRQTGNRTFTCTFPSSLVFNAPILLQPLFMRIRNKIRVVPLMCSGRQLLNGLNKPRIFGHSPSYSIGIAICRVNPS